MLQCVAVRCICVPGSCIQLECMCLMKFVSTYAVYCSVLQCVASVYWDRASNWNARVGLHLLASVLQCVALCCRMLQCVVVRSSVLQCVAVCGDMYEQCVAAHCSVLRCVAECCSVLQCVAVYSKCILNGLREGGGASAFKLQCVAMCCSVL